jgi:hypothetical protein
VRLQAGHVGKAPNEVALSLIIRYVRAHRGDKPFASLMKRSAVGEDIELSEPERKASNVLLNDAHVQDHIVDQRFQALKRDP